MHTNTTNIHANTQSTRIKGKERDKRTTAHTHIVSMRISSNRETFKTEKDTKTSLHEACQGATITATDHHIMLN